MESACSRCHQPVDESSCYCPTCGLPQLVYSNDQDAGQAQQTKWNEAINDAGSVEWKPALRAAMLLALPAGLLSSGIWPLGILGLFWVLTAAAWAVTLYVRGRRSRWITMGAGARIGLVTGLIAAALAFSITGIALFVQRFLLHQASVIDTQWKLVVDTSVRLMQQMMSQMGLPDQGQYQSQRNLMLSPEGHAGYEILNIAWNNFFMVVFAAIGGAVGARLLARSRRQNM